MNGEKHLGALGALRRRATGSAVWALLVTVGLAACMGTQLSGGSPGLATALTIVSSILIIWLLFYLTR